MYRTELSRRLTHRYRDGWSHLDSWSVGTNAKVFPERPLAPRGEDGWLCKGYVEFADKRLTLGQAQELIRINLSYSRCRHEYDCCGCSLRRVSRVWRIGRGRFGYLVQISYNN